MEFNLSDKIPKNPNYVRKYIKVKDVKEFIRLLKEEILSSQIEVSLETLIKINNKMEKWRGRK